MRRFIARLLIFISPIVLLICLLIWGSFYIGESIPVKMVVAMQQNDSREIIYHPNWTRQDSVYYKFLRTSLSKPNMLILGSSRMFQFRSEFFTEQPDVVYNAAIASLDPNESIRFISALKEVNALPDILIISIDLPYLNADETDKSDNRVPRIRPPLSFEFDHLLHSINNTAKEWLSNPSIIPVHLHNSRSNIEQLFFGMYAMTNTYGFRNDGSLYFGSIEANLQQRLAADRQQLTNSNEAFEIGSELNTDTLADIEQLLQFTYNNEIQVLAILPPYRQEFFDVMIESGHYGYIDKAIPELEIMFSRYDAYLFNFTNPNIVGGQDSELFDSWHSGELLSLRMLKYIAEACPELFSPFTDIDKLNSIIENADNPFQVFYAEH